MATINNKSCPGANIYSPHEIKNWSDSKLECRTFKMIRIFQNFKDWNFCGLNTSLQDSEICQCIKRWAFKRWLGHEDSFLVIEIRSLIKEIQEVPLFRHFLLLSCVSKIVSWKGRSHPHQTTCQHLDLGFPVSRTVRKQISVHCILPNPGMEVCL
jgi:hypothetical protein